MKYKSISKKQDESQYGKAKGESLPISFKKSVEFCRLLMGKKLSLAYKIIDEVKAMKTAVPFKRYNASVAHKKGIGPGRFPIKTAIELEKMLKNAEKNATSKGLDANSLVILHMSADKGPTTYKPSRHRGRVAKRTHIEIVLISKRSEKKELKDIVSKGKTSSQKKNKSPKNNNENSNAQKNPAPIDKKETDNLKSSDTKTVDKEKMSQSQVQAQKDSKKDSKKEENAPSNTLHTKPAEENNPVKNKTSEDKNSKDKDTKDNKTNHTEEQKNNPVEKTNLKKEHSSNKNEQKTDNVQGAKK